MTDLPALPYPALSLHPLHLTYLPDEMQAYARQHAADLAALNTRLQETNAALNARLQEMGRREGVPVYLVATGDVDEGGRETYTRHELAPPALCDSERLYTSPSPAIPATLKIALEDFDSMESLGPTTEAVIDAAQKWYLAAPTAPFADAAVREMVRDIDTIIGRGSVRWDDLTELLGNLRAALSTAPEQEN